MSGAGRICWITPDYFLNVDAKVVPQLANHYSIDWVLLSTSNSKRTSEGLVIGSVRPRHVCLHYRQRDPRIITQYAAILRSIRKQGCDLIYTSFHGLPYFLFVLPAIIDTDRVIYGIHNVHTPKGAVHERWMRLYQRYVLTVMKRFHVFSKYQLRTIAGLLPAKQHYYAPIVPDDYGSSVQSPPRDRIRFLFFGYIRRYKRLDLLIEAFKALRRSGVRNIELLIAGRCDDWEYYKALIGGEAGINCRIGVVPNRDIPDLVSSSHYLVLPYQDGAQSGVLGLAYRYNKPVITSDIDAFKEDVIEESTGFCFRSLSLDSLVSVMRDVVCRHEAIYDSLKKNVREYVNKEFSMEEIVALYRGFLDEALSGCRA